MKYMFMIYEDETDPVSNAPDVGPAYGALATEWRSKRMHLGGEALVARTEARTVRSHSGPPIVTDGPSTETKEALAGYMILDCKDMDEALEYAKRMPTAHFGAIEVRAVHQ